MKKMIPVYALQLLMLAVFVFVSFRVLREMESIKTELKTELSSIKSSGGREPRDAPALRVVVTNAVRVQEPVDVTINR